MQFHLMADNEQMPGSLLKEPDRWIPIGLALVWAATVVAGVLAAWVVLLLDSGPGGGILAYAIFFVVQAVAVVIGIAALISAGVFWCRGGRAIWAIVGSLPCTAYALLAVSRALLF